MEKLVRFPSLNPISPPASLKEISFQAIKNAIMSNLLEPGIVYNESMVALAPGSIFGSRGEEYLRLSFAVSAERPEEGIPRIKRGIETLKHHGPFSERRNQSGLKEAYRENDS